MKYISIIVNDSCCRITHSCGSLNNDGTLLSVEPIQNFQPHV